MQKNLAPNKGSSAMGSPAANPKILYRNSRLLRMVFLQLHRQQRADLFCDVVLQAEGEAVPAHCCILSACSPFFTERLEREMPPKGHKVVLELRGLKIGPLRKLVDFLYTSEMEVSREEAQDVLAAARQLQVSELESLQLEGGKLVKKALGRRLNRECLQLSSPVSIPEENLMQSLPASRVRCLTSHLLASRQQTALQHPCTKETGNSSSASQKETVKEKSVIKSEDKPAIKSEDKYQMPADASAMAEFLTPKAKKHSVGAVKDIMGNEETGNLSTEQARPRVKQAMAGLQESKKIKLSRPKLSSPPLPMPCTPEDHGVIVSHKISKSTRRLWRKKSSPVKDDTKEAEVLRHLHGFLSPSLLPKATKGRKRSASEPAPSINHPQEAGQVHRVKLRKVINGSCWEVVQEPSAAHPIRAADSVHVLTEASPPQPKYTEQEVTATHQQASSTKHLLAKAESSSFTGKSLVGKAGSAVTLADRGSYQLLMRDQLAEGEGYDSLASTGELEHMLDLLLADDDAVEASQDTIVPEGMPASGPAPKTSNSPLGNAGAEGKCWCSAGVCVCPQWIKEEKSPPQGEEGCAASKISEGTPGLTNGVPFPDPVHSCLPLSTYQSSNDCLPLCSLTSPQQESLTAHHRLPELANGATRLTAPLLSHENQGLPSCGEATSSAETKPQPQAFLRNPLQHHLDSSSERGVLKCSDPSP
ncbi:BTB/POZ domain-containing protein 18 isoform X2 [Heteronotia binoei]|uniref:BTB/POZ domain-containing protein 18 isoform X2 n=2 Tax=Heteronotia binoei TaxID=13085 RepID=UPI00292E178F|nr:BTB/POZ domain-containing protein 18 isoform X2 [Heteronotia binoei]